jgi:hypothetical protein
MTQAKPKTKIHCDVCNKDICSTMYSYHLKSASHAYHVQRQQDQSQPKTRRKRLIVNEVKNEENNPQKNEIAI